MPFQTGLPAALARFGLKVEVVPGWETRGSSLFAPVGAISHWTAGPRNATGRPSLNVVLNGRPGLPGPLANVYLDRDGIAVVTAAGKANHGGVGTWGGRSGNSLFFGTEAEAADSSDWTPAQRVAYPRVNAAYCWLRGFEADMCCGHSEYATPAGRKVDINGWPMSAMRSDVAAVLANPQQEDDMPLTDAEIEKIAQRTRQVVADGTLPYGLDSIRRQLDAIGQAVARADANDSPEQVAALVVEAVRGSVSAGGSVNADELGPIVEAAVRRVFADAAS